MKFTIETKPLDGGFAGFVEGSMIKGEAKIFIDTGMIALALAEENAKPEEFYEILSDCTVHEMLHAFQEMYKKEFDEDQVEDAISQAKAYIARTSEVKPW